MFDGDSDDCGDSDHDAAVMAPSTFEDVPAALLAMSSTFIFLDPKFSVSQSCVLESRSAESLLGPLDGCSRAFAEHISSKNSPGMSLRVANTDGAGNFLIPELIAQSQIQITRCR